MKTNHNQGFTLVELAIMLVITSFIAGGILVGRDLITSAQIRATARQIDMFNTSFSAFLLKYNCMPGDCGNAEDLGFRPMVVTVSDARPLPQYNIRDYFNVISDAVANPIEIGPGVPVGQLGLAAVINMYEETYLPGEGMNYAPAPEQTVLIPVNGDGGGTLNTEEEALGAHVTLAEADMIPGFNIVTGTVPIRLDVTSPINGKRAFLLYSYMVPKPNSLFSVAGSYITITATAIPNNGATATFTGSQAFWLDSKYDDGHALTGLVRSTNKNGLPENLIDGMVYDANTTNAQTCIYNGDYNLKLGESREPDKLCTPVLKAATMI
jgi:hypothetical protein